MKIKSGIVIGAMAATMAAGCASAPEGPTPEEIAAQEAEAARLAAEAAAKAKAAEEARLAAEAAAKAKAEEEARLAALRAAQPQPGSAADFAAATAPKVFFDVDQYNLSAAARSTLEAQAEWLNKYPTTTILVAGNCDERGTREYNIALGERRASAAKDFLVSLGVSPSRIETVSYGKDRPTDPRSTPDAWAVNRNATTQLLSGATS